MGVCDMHVAKKCAQKRQAPLWILLGAVPIDQRCCGEPMPHVVETKSMTVARSTQPNAPRGGVERAMYLRDIQSIAPARNEQVRGDSTVRPMALALLEVSGQHCAGGGMQWNVPVLPPFTTADSEHLSLQINILKLEVTRFTQTKTRDSEQAKQTVIDSGQQRADPAVPRGEWHIQRGVQQLFNLLIGIKVGPRPLGLKGQQTLCRNLRARINCASVACELAYVTEPAGPIRGLRMSGHLCPTQCQRLRNVRGAATFHELRKARQHPTSIVHLEAETSAQGQVLGNRLSEGVHGTPPGQR